jgi:regulatory subunit for Cdc7p protein kinase
MTTVSRRPLNPRSLPQLPAVVSPLSAKFRSGSTTSKRPRSPDPCLDQQQPLSAKRPRPTPPESAVPGREEDHKLKERKRLEREAQREEFRTKYTRAFPSWIFYLDWDVSDIDEEPRKRLQARVLQMGAVRIIQFEYMYPGLFSYLSHMASV